MAKQRSPNYPAIGLKEAVSRAERLYGIERQATVSEIDAVQAIGYSGMSGPSRTVLSALRKYGLVDDVAGGVRISPLTMAVMFPQGDSERSQALREAALKPELFKELWDQYSVGGSDNAIRSYLIRRGFSPDGANRVTRAFRDTVEFANLADTPYNPPESLDASDLADTMVTTTPATRRAASSPAPETVFMWRLGDRTAELRTSDGRLTRADITNLRDLLNIAERTASDDAESA